MVRMPSSVGTSLSSTPPPPLTCRSMKPGTSMPPPAARTGTVADRGGPTMPSMPPSRTSRAASFTPALAIEDAGADIGGWAAHTVSVTFLRCGGAVGIEATAPRQRFDEAVEGDDQHQRVGERVAGHGKRQGSRSAGPVGGDERHGPLRRELIGHPGDRGFGGVARGQHQQREAAFDDAGRAMHDFGGAIGFGVDAAGFLEFQRRLGGNRQRRAAAQHVERLVAIERLEQRRPVAVRRRPAAPPASVASAASSFSSAVQCASTPSPATTELTKLLVAATLRFDPGPQVDGEIGGGSQRRLRGVGERDAERAAALRADSAIATMSGALAGLRHGDRRGAVELQLAAVDRDDRRADRGDGNASRQLDRIFEKRRGVIGRAAGDGRDHRWIVALQRLAGLASSASLSARKRCDRIRDLLDLAGACGWLRSLAFRCRAARRAGVRRRSHRYRHDISNG